MEDITAVPRFPQPMMPMRMAEFALDPNTIPGFKIIAAVTVAAFLIKVIRFI